MRNFPLFFGTATYNRRGPAAVGYLLDNSALFKVVEFLFYRLLDCERHRSDSFYTVGGIRTHPGI